jgi:hypothetical protein
MGSIKDEPLFPWDILDESFYCDDGNIHQKPPSRESKGGFKRGIGGKPRLISLSISFLSNIQVSTQSTTTRGFSD